jgi:hypothetical protein
VDAPLAATLQQQKSGHTPATKEKAGEMPAFLLPPPAV